MNLATFYNKFSFSNFVSGVTTQVWAPAPSFSLVVSRQKTPYRRDHDESFVSYFDLIYERSLARNMIKFCFSEEMIHDYRYD